MVETPLGTHPHVVQRLGRFHDMLLAETRRRSPKELSVTRNGKSASLISAMATSCAKSGSWERPTMARSSTSGLLSGP